MADFTIQMPGGLAWVPRFIAAIAQEKCIGCGRCTKVCGRGVLQLMGVNEEGEFIALDPDDDDDEEYEKKVMTIGAREACIGCEACGRTCTKKCISHAPAEALA